MKRVAAYCRVSTEQDDQLNSLENQKRYFEQYIENNIEWEFCGLYVDEGISGTSVEKRAGFQRMVVDAENKKFDLLLTKEISRFARNTLDSIFYTRKLKGLGVGVVFMNDNINTLDADAELRLTIMSSIAQEESRKMSERIKWGQKRCMEKGFAFGACPLGYNLKNGKLTINEDEAKIVRLIFELYLSGLGVQLVSKELENRGISAPNGATRWKNTTILRILKNEKYSGMLKQKKKITTDYLSHRRKVNEGEEKYIIVENSHAPIVDKEIFDRTQKELARRKNATFEKSRYSNRHVWSSKIKCAYCNSTFKRKINNSKSNSPQLIWQCSEAEKYGREKVNAQGKKVGCNCKAVPEWVLKENFWAGLNAVIENKERVIQELKKSVQNAIDKSPNKAAEIKAIGAEMVKTGNRKMKLVELYADGEITRDEYNKANSQYNKQLDALEKQMTALKLDNKIAEDLTQKLANVEKVIETLVNFKEYSDSVCGEVLHKVVVEGREKMSFYLTTGENTDPAFFKIPLLIHQDLLA
ncbi:MAG: recombinase family protein [Nitrososphaerota archaeon]|jgi:DNA invertase Pin-like site-specific DNA recombinase|nr:recombinase family protein [Nitrososphaerota archaeon]